jgi:hypothetical protein
MPEVDDDHDYDPDKPIPKLGPVTLSCPWFQWNCLRETLYRYGITLTHQVCTEDSGFVYKGYYGTAPLYIHIPRLGISFDHFLYVISEANPSKDFYYSNSGFNQLVHKILEFWWDPNKQAWQESWNDMQALCTGRGRSQW